MSTAEIITDEQVDKALDRVEQTAGVETANLLRNCIRGLRALLWVYQAGSDDDED